MRRDVPVREVRDELEQRLAEVLVRRARTCAAHLRQELPRLRLELRRAERIARVRPEQREQHRPARRQRPPRPPQVQRARMPVPDRLLPRRVPRHLGDREVHLGEALAVLGDHAVTLLVSSGLRLCPFLLQLRIRRLALVARYSQGRHLVFSSNMDRLAEKLVSVRE